MASKRHVRRVACGSKKRYASQEEAGRHAGAARYAYGGYFAVYRCRWCGGFHIGHANEATRRALRERGAVA